MTSRPPWLRLDTDLFESPKIQRALARGSHSAVLLWVQGIAYSTRYLTDGWVPLPMPRQWGYRDKHVEALVETGLWYPLEITDDGGWLIHDFADHQPTRAEWEAKTEKRRAAARRSWAER